MNTNQVRTICELAGTLPAYHQTTTRRMQGAELIAIGITEVKGKAVQPNGWYPVDVMVTTNQVRTLQRIANTRGWDAMLEHVHRVRMGQPLMHVVK